MSKIKLVSQSSAYDELFTTATYTEGVGIYPAYENALRSAISFTNVVSQDLQNGKFTINVPTGQSAAYFIGLKTGFPQNSQHTIYFKSSIGISVEVSATGGGATYYANTNITEDVFNITITDDINTAFVFRPNLADYDTDIEIEYTIIPKGYPQLQSWGGSQLTATLSGVKSISFQLKDWDATKTTWQSAPPILEVDGLEVLQFRPYSPTGQLNGQLATIKGVSGGDFNTTIKKENNDIITISDDGTNITFYKNQTALNIATSTNWRLSEVIFNARTTTGNLTFKLPQLVTSTEESTGYPQGTIIAIQPTCKLGILGSEMDLPTKSRTISTMRRDVKKIELESVNATPTTQYIATKRKLDINYEIINESDKASILAIEDSQYTQKSRLNYIYNSESGQLHNMTVRMTTASAGNRIQRDKYFEAAIGMELKEC